MTLRVRLARSAGLAALGLTAALCLTACGGSASGSASVSPGSGGPGSISPGSIGNGTTISVTGTPGALDQQSYDQMLSKVNAAQSAASVADSDASADVSGAPTP